MWLIIGNKNAYTTYLYDIRFVSQSGDEKIYVQNNIKRLKMYSNKLCSLNIFPKHRSYYVYYYYNLYLGVCT